MNNKIQTALSTLSLTAIALLSPWANAATNTEVCTDDGGLVCISETYDHAQSESVGSDQSFYSVTNNTAERIFGFGVTNSNGGGAYISHGYQNAWDAATLSAEEWDAGSAYFSYYYSGNRQAYWVTGKNASDGANPLGSFETLFGDTTTETGDQMHVNFYWNLKNYYMLQPGDTLGKVSSNRRTEGEFYFHGVPESDATFFNRAGNVVASTHFIPIDETQVIEETIAETTETTSSTITVSNNNGNGATDEVTVTNTENPVVDNGNASNDDNSFIDDLIGSNAENPAIDTSASNSDIGSLISDTVTLSATNTPALGSAVAAVPEPETYMMLLSGLVLIGISKRKKAKA